MTRATLEIFGTCFSHMFCHRFDVSGHGHGVHILHIPTTYPIQICLSNHIWPYKLINKRINIRKHGGTFSRKNKSKGKHNTHPRFIIQRNPRLIPLNKKIYLRIYFGLFLNTILLSCFCLKEKKHHPTLFQVSFWFKQNLSYIPGCFL